jgi:hypothetical protein
MKPKKSPLTISIHFAKCAFAPSSKPPFQPRPGLI